MSPLANPMAIHVVESIDPAFAEAIASLPDDVPSFVVDNAKGTDWAALVISDDEVVGLATLGLRDLMDGRVPMITAVWVRTDHRLRGIGLRLLNTLIEQSETSFCMAPCIVAGSDEGAALIERALQHDMPLITL